MVDQDKKSQTFLQLNNSGSRATVDLVKDLVLCMVEELRFDNDIAKGDDVLLNQGGIKAYHSIVTLLNEIK